MEEVDVPLDVVPAPPTRGRNDSFHCYCCEKENTHCPNLQENQVFVTNILHNYDVLHDTYDYATWYDRTILHGMTHTTILHGMTHRTTTWHDTQNYTTWYDTQNYTTWHDIELYYMV